MKDARVPLMESIVTQILEDYFAMNGFIRMHPNRLTRASGACENIETLYEVLSNHDPEWFRTPEKEKIRAYLAQTAQLALEAWVPELKKVYCIGSSFRAEDKVDNRHLTEFTMLEIEFAGDFEELMRYIEGVIAYVAEVIIVGLEMDPDEIFGKIFDNDKKGIISRLEKWELPFPRIRYNDAILILQKGNNAKKWGDDISTKEEQVLIEELGGKPIFITHFPNPQFVHGQPIEVEKFFNMIPDPNNPEYVLSCDLILPHSGEAVGAAQRIADIKTLEERLVHSKMFQLLIRYEVKSEYYVSSQSMPSAVFNEFVENFIKTRYEEVKAKALSNFQWYFDNIQRHGMVKHAGCGFGMSRILQAIWGSDDIRKCVTFPVNRETIDSTPLIYNN